MTLNTDTLISDIRDAYKRWSRPEEARFNPLSKCTKFAHMHRENGMKHYSAKKFKDAVCSYTFCIAYALDDSEELAQGYGDRSAAFFELEKYAPCLYDINRALRSHCSYALRKELVSRKKRCLARMKSSSAGGSSNGNDEEVDEDATDPPSDREPEWRAEMLIQFGNPLLPNASPKIKLKYDEIWGSHFVATADIRVGEPLLSEEFFLTISPLDRLFEVCDFCVSSCDALIPCPWCAKTVYCSETCRSRAYDSYHRIECSLSYLIYCGTPVDAFAIRLFLIGTEQGAALENLMNTLSISDIFARNRDFMDKSFCSDYLTALSMTRWPFDQAKVKSSIMNAVQIVVELRKDKFFESVSVKRLEDAKVFATALLINNLAERYSCKFNVAGHTMSHRTITNKNCPYVGLMLLQQSFNHSCYPNVACYKRKREMILFAVRPVKKDGQLFIAYCNDFLSGIPKAERTRALGFDCQCEACSNNWPTHVETGVSEMNSVPEIHRKMMKELIPYNDPTSLFEHNPVLSEIMKVVAPLLDDTTLLNLRTGEIFRIMADAMSLLYEVMVPTSLVFVELRRYFLFFAELYYSEREPHRSQNKSVTFPRNTRLTDEKFQAKFGYHLNNAIFNSHFLNTVFDVISKLNSYALEGTFIVEKNVG